MKHHDVIIIGAGAAGLMCAATAGYRGRDVLVLDNAKQAGKKILISGGGRCNFTNQKVEPQQFICGNPHFVKSALARYRSSDFIELVERHGIEYHERDHGQLFCNDSAKEIVTMLMTECEWAGAKVKLRTEILSVSKTEAGFNLNTSNGDLSCDSLVIATGGLSMPKLGATPYGYKLAEQFGLKVLPTSAGLVPFTWHSDQKIRFEPLSGIAVPTTITAQDGTQFSEALLFTHRGLSGPAVLQISNYWQPGEAISINLLPGESALDKIEFALKHHPKQSLRNTVSQWLPKRLVEALFEESQLDKALNQLGHGEREKLANELNHWSIIMNGTEGYRTAEVTLGGVDSNELSSKTMQANKVPGLYFIGEVMDVSGWLGGFNFQWAWSSGVAAGLAV
ncbi:MULTISPECIES: BaiN/RdsA family NAD(P)/FAD-dependent oxidoreductase [Shewanella]|uniref:NAD(P)/FAD-dependent oxidoreductase n=1 Tax=Shewanella psychromarinicola TaxID=2487742 RepID=A0A3N4ETE0_9GAMM|nr:NAD(P)/FAD-dependent oxidoreductase [Shewanella psychromarinicola]AZG34288.1 NAD(P)/FAD-dependent oxidoreductase [Shewanella psychromarinicola]MCL1083519.1 NAD(P)/FAD-dependent oxidoreductase [Shewanella psychromarinicola]RPA32384.1 NAD(P)/FAD-dependent oxidoreductase [Shewanella psychromarinicola]